MKADEDAVPLSDLKRDIFRELIQQSPPGQLSDCFNDLHGLLAGDREAEELPEAIRPAVAAYNKANYITAKLDGADEPVLICDLAEFLLGNDVRYLDPKSKQSFVFDHNSHETSDPQPLHVWESLEKIRAELQEAASAYAQEHHSQGVATVFSASAPAQPAPAAPEQDETPEANVQAEAETEAEADPAPQSATEAEAPPAAAEESEPPETEAQEEQAHEEQLEKQQAEEEKADAPEQAEKPSVPADIPEPTERKFSLRIAGNRHDASNLWAGRWKGTYDLDYDSGKLTGAAEVHVHYYEGGNVQMLSDKKLSVDLTPGAATGKDVLKHISDFERSHQVTINEMYAQVSDTTLRALRRTLPVTKQKMDWNKLTAYKLKSALPK